MQSVPPRFLLPIEVDTPPAWRFVPPLVLKCKIQSACLFIRNHIDPLFPITCPLHGCFYQAESEWKIEMPLHVRVESLYDTQKFPKKFVSVCQDE